MAKKNYPKVTRKNKQHERVLKKSDELQIVFDHVQALAQVGNLADWEQLQTGIVLNYFGILAKHIEQVKTLFDDVHNYLCDN